MHGQFIFKSRPIPSETRRTDLHKPGDSHNPDDPFFKAFKERTLRQYGVTRVEALPVNHNGLLATEGEKRTMMSMSFKSARSAIAMFYTPRQRSTS
ncbi:DUF3526 domain-containing protein [Sphingomonas sp. NFR15]|uniref:DUF3526 domain-containing protein n=1 Tax=Sphingomonas sp. NFR15 TaxID=1566282 RepID=UPI00088B6FA6|nr:protein of unknown function [Sphingomonas sp. NFR15]